MEIRMDVTFLRSNGFPYEGKALKVRTNTKKVQSEISDCTFWFYGITPRRLGGWWRGGRLSLIHIFEDMTGVDAQKIPLDDQDTMSIFTSSKVLGLSLIHISTRRAATIWS